MCRETDEESLDSGAALLPSTGQGNGSQRSSAAITGWMGCWGQGRETGEEGRMQPVLSERQMIPFVLNLVLKTNTNTQLPLLLPMENMMGDFLQPSGRIHCRAGHAEHEAIPVQAGSLTGARAQPSSPGGWQVLHAARTGAGLCPSCPHRSAVSHTEPRTCAGLDSSAEDMESTA